MGKIIIINEEELKKIMNFGCNDPSKQFLVIARGSQKSPLFEVARRMINGEIINNHLQK